MFVCCVCLLCLLGLVYGDLIVMGWFALYLCCNGWMIIVCLWGALLLGGFVFPGFGYFGC